MTARKSTRPAKHAPPPASTMDVEPDWLVEFGEDEAPTAKRKPSKRPKAPSVPAPASARGARPPPLPSMRVPSPIITQKPSTTMDVDPEWLEEVESRAAPEQTDEAPTRRRAKKSERPLASVPRPSKK